ncbi:hypothetical protein V5O48_018960 [Marasmius crinis-equi]|uniref:SET domain-containing protein n=1 Tax=Marasmius crinis-equi TaxID=585013 RepID=A0ABR3EJT3_9AGAR
MTRCTLTQLSPKRRPHLSFNSKTFGLELHAACPIKKGDELFIQYHDIEPLIAAGQEELAPYGFQCRCQTCQESTKSDLLRRMLCVKPLPERPLKRLVVWLMARGSLSPGNRRDVVQPYFEQLRLLEEVPVWYRGTLSALGMVYCMMGNADEAFECLHKREMILYVKLGQPRESDQQIRKWIVDSPRWRWRNEVQKIMKHLDILLESSK